jgi:hypothetical protein
VVSGDVSRETSAEASALRVSWFDLPDRPVNGTVFVRAAAVTAVALCAACAAAPTPQPALDGIGVELARAGDHISVAAMEVDLVPRPVPVPGSPSCSRPGCR